MFIEKPLSNFILIDLIEPEDDSILVLPEAVKAGLAIKYGRVIKVHDDYVMMNGEKVVCPVEEGDVVMFLAMTAAPLFVKHGDKEYLMIPSNSLAATVSDVKQKQRTIELLK